MELRHLRYFLSVADQGSFSRAAAHLHVAQPAVSRQIRDLESELGIALFDRSRGRGRTRLTHAGKYLLDDVRRIISNADLLVERGQRAALGQFGTLTLGLLDAYAWRGPIPRCIHQYRSRFPNVDLSIQLQQSHDQLLSVRAKRLDAGFFFHRPPSDESLRAVPILRDRFVLAVPRNSRLARKPPRRLRDLANENFIWLPRDSNPSHYDRILTACRAAGFVPRVVQEVPTATAMLALVAAGVGCTFALGEVRRRKPSSVTMIPLRDLDFPITLELVWAESNDSPLLRAFVAEAVAATKLHG